MALQAEEEAHLEQAPHLQKRRSSWVGWLMGAQESRGAEPRARLGSEIKLDAAQRATLAALGRGRRGRNATADASPWVRRRRVVGTS